MSDAPAWRTFLDTRFPGYLLPESAVHAMSVEQASKFLTAISGRPDQLDIVRAASTLAPHAEGIVRFVLEDLTGLVRVLPSRAEVHTKTWTGGFQGRLDIARTSILHAQGASSSFVTRSRRRKFDLPENILVRAVAERLLGALTLLRKAHALKESGWSEALYAMEGPLRRLTVGTVLREVPTAQVTAHEQQAAQVARHPAYRTALAWFRILHDGLDSNDPATIARMVATGALEPLADYTQFEIAVLVRIAETLHERLEATQPNRWTLHRTLVRHEGEEAFIFARDDGARVRVIYNRAELPSGACDLGTKHYLASGGRMRPDVTVITELEPGRLARATVFEVKLTDDVGYMVQGYREAVVYKWEYLDALTGWPKAILVVPGTMPGGVREADDVVAVGWRDWLSESVVSGLLREVLQ